MRYEDAKKPAAPIKAAAPVKVVSADDPVKPAPQMLENDAKKAHDAMASAQNPNYRSDADGGHVSASCPSCGYQHREGSEVPCPACGQVKEVKAGDACPSCGAILGKGGAK